jgi:hypothetical protein
MSSGTKTGKQRAAGGFTLLISLVLLLLLTSIVGTIVIRATSENRTSGAYIDLAQSQFSAISGLEEVRGRLLSSGSDAIPAGNIPGTVGQVLYITNSKPGDTVVPNNASSIYYDKELLQEFPNGATATLLPSNNPFAQTSSDLSYKWVRVTLKTEYSSKQDLNQDGILDQATPIVYDGKNQYLSTQISNGIPVYILTALAVQPSGESRLLQYDVSNRPPVEPAATVTSWGDVQLSGSIVVNGTQGCSTGPSVYGAMGAGSYSQPAGPTVTGTPTGHLAPASLGPPTPASLVSQYASIAVPILAANPSGVTYSSTNHTYSGSYVTFGSLPVYPPTVSNPAVPAFVYADHTLSINSGSGAGVLLVQGDLSITGGFTYYGLIVATGNVSIQGDGSNVTRIRGAVLQGGTFTASSSGAGVGLRLRFDSCALAGATTLFPKTVLGFRELQP